MLDVVEEVILTFKCNNDADVVCFQRLIDRNRGTYLADPSGGYALFERVIGPEGRILSILSSSDVKKLLGKMVEEGDEYVCLEMKVEANRLNTVVFRLRKPIKINPTPGSIIIKPYFDVAFSDQITNINATDGQSQYIQVLLNNEHMRIKYLNTRDEIENLFHAEGIEQGSHRLYLAGNKGFAYSFKINAINKAIGINYYLTLSDFYKYMLLLVMIPSIIGIMGLSILMAVRLIGPSLVLPIITTLALILISAYITIPKESVIRYKGIELLTILVIITLIISIIIVGV